MKQIILNANIVEIIKTVLFEELDIARGEWRSYK